MRALVLANGPLGARSPGFPDLAGHELVVAADGGARHAGELGLALDVVVGDLDSIDPALHRELEMSGVEIHRFPARKDEIDLELALREAVRRGATEATVLGALGARWDQPLANLMLAFAPELASIALTFVEGSQVVRMLRGPVSLELDETPGSTVSLIPVGGDVSGLRSEGLDYALNGDTLPFGTPRGVSNVVVSRPARVAFERGALCVVVLVNR